MNETKVPMESKILQVARYLETGQISQRQIAATCHVSKESCINGITENA